MIYFPNAKINIGLNVIEKRKDGFHNIETVFYPLGLCDALEIIATNNKVIEFQTSGIKVPGHSDSNLCFKACSLMTTSYDLPKMNIYLHKNIPLGAGLGGGSADAAFTIKLINELFKLKLTTHDMLEKAKLLGSDCPFFILNTPAYATEKGDNLEKIDLDLSKYLIVLICLPININTAKAYSLVSPEQRKHSLKKLIKLPVGEWKNNIYNDFEKVVFQKYPEIGLIKNQLYKQGAIYASMSGSGAGVFGLFEKNILLSETILKDCFVWKSQ